MAVVTLLHPVDINGRRYEALTLRRARTRELRYLDRSGCLDLMTQLQASPEGDKRGSTPPGLIDKIVPLLASLADVDEAVIDALDGDDLFQLFERLEEVMPQGPLPAETTSTGKERR